MLKLFTYCISSGILSDKYTIKKGCENMSDKKRKLFIRIVAGVLVVMMIFSAFSVAFMA